jgi:predicted O-methyltransferase YrrM
MLELIGTPGRETISVVNAISGQVIKNLFAQNIMEPVVAEIGVGIGTTTLSIAQMLNNQGQLHLFDFEESVMELTHDLAARGFLNVRGHGNTSRHWDSYNWTLGKMILGGDTELFDYIYIDGAHTFGTDALAFFLCDKLLKTGGFIEFDDHDWTFQSSRWMQDIRHEFMTDEQIATPQVAMVIDLCLTNNKSYETIMPKRLFRKVAS